MTKILKGATVAQPIAVPAGRRWGYGRVSTEQQTEAQQRAQLEAAGCDEVITEQISSGKADRPGLAQVLGALQRGDQLVVAKLDRLARSLVELLAIASDLEAGGIDLVVLDQAIDTSTPAGRLMFQVLGAVSQFERELAIERTRASVAHRRAIGGDLGGRRKSYSDQQLALGHRLRGEGQSISQIAAALGLSRGTTHRLLLEKVC